MSYIVTVTKRTPAPTSISDAVAGREHAFIELKVFEQEFDDLNLSKFVTELNRTKRVYKRTAKVSAT